MDPAGLSLSVLSLTVRVRRRLRLPMSGVGPDAEGVGVVGAEHPQQIGEQLLEGGHRAGGVAGLPRQRARLGRNLRVSGWPGPHPHLVGEELLVGSHRVGGVAGLAPPMGEVGPGGEGVGVVGA
jgi:hypothetical protein